MREGRDTSLGSRRKGVRRSRGEWAGPGWIGACCIWSSAVPRGGCVAAVAGEAREGSEIDGAARGMVGIACGVVVCHAAFYITAACLMT